MEGRKGQTRTIDLTTKLVTPRAPTALDAALVLGFSGIVLEDYQLTVMGLLMFLLVPMLWGLKQASTAVTRGVGTATRRPTGGVRFGMPSGGVAAAAALTSMLLLHSTGHPSTAPYAEERTVQPVVLAAPVFFAAVVAFCLMREHKPLQMAVGAACGAVLGGMLYIGAAKLIKEVSPDDERWALQEHKADDWLLVGGGGAMLIASMTFAVVALKARTRGAHVGRS